MEQIPKKNKTFKISKNARISHFEPIGAQLKSIWAFLITLSYSSVLISTQSTRQYRIFSSESYKNIRRCVLHFKTSGVWFWVFFKKRISRNSLKLRRFARVCAPIPFPIILHVMATCNPNFFKIAIISHWDIGKNLWSFLFVHGNYCYNYSRRVDTRIQNFFTRKFYSWCGIIPMTSIPE